MLYRLLYSVLVEMKKSMTQNKRNRNICAMALVLTALLVFTKAAIADENGFSMPTTAPEKALHAILRSYMQEYEKQGSDTSDFWTQQRVRHKEMHRYFEGKFARYEGKFTSALVRAVSAHDQEMRKECEPADGICGLDYDPVLCAQDILLPPHAYFTTRVETTQGQPSNNEAGAARAYVLYRHGPAGDAQAHRTDYLLENERGRWKIAGVRCLVNGVSGTSFNMR